MHRSGRRGLRPRRGLDNGVGISSETLPRIFNHGFTTKPDGHGFGLHGAALTAKEMGGELTAHSDGVGRGARFSLVLPVGSGRDGAGSRVQIQRVAGATCTRFAGTRTARAADR